MVLEQPGAQQLPWSQSKTEGSLTLLRIFFGKTLLSSRMAQFSCMLSSYLLCWLCQGALNLVYIKIMSLRPDLNSKKNKSQGQIVLLTAIKRHVWKYAGIIAYVFKMYENFSTEKCMLGQKVYFPMSPFSCCIGFALIMAKKIIIPFSSLGLCFHLGQRHSYRLLVVLLYLSVSASECWEVEGEQWTSVDMLLSLIFFTSLHAKISSHFSPQTRLPSTSFSSTVHPNGFILPSSRWVWFCSQSPSKEWPLHHILSHSLEDFFT